MWKNWLCLLLCILLTAPALAEDAGQTRELTPEEMDVLLWQMYQTQNDDAEFMVLPDDWEEPAQGKSGIFHLLLIGVDSGEDLAGRSDTMLLAAFNAYTGELKLVSFMRDLYVSIPRHGRNRLNASYAYGGADLLCETLEKVFSVHVDAYLSVNYSLMVELVDAIGGVELTVEDEEVPKLNGILRYYNKQRGVPQDEGVLEQPGTQVLTGLQTMSYARIRKLDSDFVRVVRQQRVILAIYNQLLQCSLEQLLNIMTTYLPKVGTDITLARAIGLLTNLLSYEVIPVTTLRVPVDGAFSSRMMNDAYYLVPNLKKNVSAIRDFLQEN